MYVLMRTYAHTYTCIYIYTHTHIHMKETTECFMLAPVVIICVLYSCPYPLHMRITVRLNGFYFMLKSLILYVTWC